MLRTSSGGVQFDRSLRVAEADGKPVAARHCFCLLSGRALPAAGGGGRSVGSLCRLRCGLWCSPHTTLSFHCGGVSSKLFCVRALFAVGDGRQRDLPTQACAGVRVVHAVPRSSTFFLALWCRERRAAENGGLCPSRHQRGPNGQFVSLVRLGHK